MQFSRKNDGVTSPMVNNIEYLSCANIVPIISLHDRYITENNILISKIPLVNNGRGRSVCKFPNDFNISSYRTNSLSHKITRTDKIYTEISFYHGLASVTEDIPNLQTTTNEVVVNLELILCMDKDYSEIVFDSTDDYNRYTNIDIPDNKLLVVTSKTPSRRVNNLLKTMYSGIDILQTNNINKLIFNPADATNNIIEKFMRIQW